MYLVAISAYHPLVEGNTVFSHPASKLFLRGQQHLYLDARLAPLAWDLPLLLCQLSRHPFEPMATCELPLLSWKMAFLVAISSARRISELATLRIIPLYLTFLPHLVKLRPDVKFPKWPQSFTFLLTLCCLLNPSAHENTSSTGWMLNGCCYSTWTAPSSPQGIMLSSFPILLRSLVPRYLLRDFLDGSLPPLNSATTLNG